MLTGLVLLVVSAFLLYAILKPRRPRNFPPGPANYPIVGASLYVSKLAEYGGAAFHKLGDIYGPVTGMFLGNQKTIIVNGYEATKEFYSRDEFPHRPNIFITSYHWGGRMLGVFFSNGKLWQEQKRFSLRHLRDFGFGKTSMEGLIHEEAGECITSIKKAIKEAGPSSVITVHDKFGVSLINILWAIIGGSRFSHDDENFKKLLKVIQDSFRTGSTTGMLVNAYPFLRHFPYFKQQFKTLISGPQELFKILEVQIDEHIKTRNPDDPRDFIDVYLQAMEESKDDPNTTFFRDQLVQVCEDFFAAGAESTSNSVGFTLLHVIRNPEIQEKMQKELDEVLGKETFPSYNDKEKLPYTYAVVNEALRMSPVAPVSVPHYNVEDVKLIGYDIPKGTFAMVSYTSTNMDKKFWGDPENFRPERFLDPNGKFDKTKLDHVFGFGAGKRVCLGESLARITNFILFTTVIQRFKFELVPGQPKPSIVPLEGFTVGPQPFSAKVTARF